jgi:hypothetical protein
LLNYLTRDAIGNARLDKPVMPISPIATA